MKIAILTPTFNIWSGIDNVVRIQAEDFVKEGQDVTVIALEGDIKPKGYKVVKLGMPKNAFLQRLYRLFFFLDVTKINYYKKLNQFDKVISHFYPMNFLAHRAKKHYKIEYIFWNHGIDEEWDNPLQKLYMRLLLKLNKFTIESADKIISVSNWARDELKEQTGLDSDIEPTKIDKKIFNKNVSGIKIRKKYNLKDKIVYLYVGRITPRKGIHLLIDYFKNVKERIPNASLVIVGKPTFKRYYEKLKNMATDKEIIFTGVVDYKELPSYYGACDFYVTTSAWECSDLPAQEAQACEKPVIAFDIGAHPEFVKNGILVKDNDKIGFVNAMVERANSVIRSKRQFI